MAKEFKFEMQMRDFNPFVNGKVNCHVPKGYNWLLGYPILPMPESKDPVKQSVTLSTARINGQHLAL